MDAPRSWVSRARELEELTSITRDNNRTLTGELQQLRDRTVMQAELTARLSGANQVKCGRRAACTHYAHHRLPRRATLRTELNPSEAAKLDPGLDWSLLPGVGPDGVVGLVGEPEPDRRNSVLHLSEAKSKLFPDRRVAEPTGEELRDLIQLVEAPGASTSHRATLA